MQQLGIPNRLRRKLHRVVPTLLLHQGGLYKTRRFRDPRYVGDPINAVRIFSDKGADELILIDIDATRKGREPMWERLREIADQAMMPMTYGGGIRNLKDIEKILRIGFEKIAVSAAAFADRNFVGEASRTFGSQSIVVVTDFRKSFHSRQLSIYTHNGTRRVVGGFTEWLDWFADSGAGELVMNNIDRDGTFSGYDHEVVASVTARYDVPVVAMGGANSVEDMISVIEDSGAAAAAAGSLFVFRSVEGGVLINYPRR